MDPSAEGTKHVDLPKAAEKARQAETSRPVQSPRAAFVARLHNTNFFARNPDAPTPSPAENQAVAEIDAREEAARHGSILLPTVGPEIELYLKSESRSLLINDLGAEVVTEGGHLREIRGPWSYSADTQIATIQQLQQMGVVPRIPGTGRETIYDSHVPISLHLNFGIPFAIHDFNAVSTLYGRDIADIVDALSLAYTSPGRAERRKTRIAHTLYKTAEPTEKFISDPNHPNDQYQTRLELRPFEVTDHFTPALLHSSQRLVAGLIAEMVDNDNTLFAGLTSQQQEETMRVADIFREFRLKLAELREQHGGFPAEFVDRDDFPVLSTDENPLPGLQPDDETLMSASQLLQRLDTVSEFRVLTDNYAKKIGEALGLSESPVPTDSAEQ